jgi:cytochrome c553
MKKLLLSLCAVLVASVTTATAFAQDKVGDPNAGEKKNALCIGCHGITGYHTGFPEVHKVPKISGQSPKFIVNALKAYKAGERKHPSMRGVAANLTEQDMADLAAYYANNGRLLPEPEKAAGGSDKAQELVTKGGCTTCHGENFSKPMDPSYPKIAGQHSDYLYFALKAYKTENVNLIGRNHPIMSGVAKQFTNAELKVLADYVGSLPGQLQTVQRDRIRN